MRVIFLWTRGRNALMRDPQVQPPRVEAIESVNTVSRERRAAVAANRVRQSVRTEESTQLAVHAGGAHVGKTLAAQYVATDVIDDGEWRAIDAIAHAELAVEIIVHM